MNEVYFDYEAMKEICLADIPWFEKFGTKVQTTRGVYYYKDNGAKILAVAHLDSVKDCKHFYAVTIEDETIIYNAQLDDRLGAYLILDLLPKLGMEYDILLTEGEETGMSTAQFFKTDKKYNWMFSFDRTGDTTVMYQYDDPKLRKRLTRAGLKPAYGSFSDIAYLGHLGCRGINVGTAYDNYHSAWATADMSMLELQVNKFGIFYSKFKDLEMPYVAPKVTYSHKAYSIDDWGDYDGYNNRNYNWHGHQLSATSGFKNLNDVPFQEELDRCDFCNKIMEANDGLTYPNICFSCTKDVLKCTGCKKVTQIVNEFDLCPVCERRTMDGSYRILTEKSCPHCKNLLYAHELMEGNCNICGEDLISLWRI